MKAARKKSIFQQRHYEFIATVLKESEYLYDSTHWELICEEWSTYLGRENPQFNPYKFFKAIHTKEKEK